jgi:hypothetical protein
MICCDPPTGEPEIDPEHDNYIWQHIHKPEIEAFIRKLYGQKR